MQEKKKANKKKPKKKLSQKTHVCVPDLERVMGPLEPLHDGLGRVQQHLHVAGGALRGHRAHEVPAGQRLGRRLGGRVRDAVAVAARVERVERADRALEADDGDDVHRLAQQHVVDVDGRGEPPRERHPGGERPDLEDVLELVAAARDDVEGRAHRGHREGVGDALAHGLPVPVGVARQHAGASQELVQERVDEAELVEVLGAEDVAREDRVGDDDRLWVFFFISNDLFFGKEEKSERGGGAWKLWSGLG